ncbi:MAG: heparinase II/III family protein [Verrucomicrobia bacterium]|nr:heparinase II/III family protein [Verrucomicrobiota bacterium]
MGALALADEEPGLAGAFLHNACVSIQLAMAEYAPDGAWAEGPGYWNYATTYNAVFLAALETALGTDFGLSQMPGFAEAATFPLYLTGPLNRTFNYADGGDGAIRAPVLFWMAKKFQHPAYAVYQKRLASPVPLDLLWYDAELAGNAKLDLPLDKHFGGADIVTFRSAWNDRDALFAGFKAGDNKANHSHLDLGSFVFDALGQRWAIDLGAENYNLPGYFGKARWTYYRLRAEGQNALVLNPDAGPDQDPSAAARLERFESKPARSFAIADLTPAYAKHARSVRRGVALLDRQRFLVQDEVGSDAPVDAWWFMHTPAEIAISPDGRSATLRQGGAALRAELVSPEQAMFEARSAAPLPGSPNPEGQNRNAGIRKLAVHVPGARELRIVVLLTPPMAENSTAAQVSVQPLAEW